MRGPKAFTENPQGLFMCTRSPWVHIQDKFHLSFPLQIREIQAGIENEGPYDFN